MKYKNLGNTGLKVSELCLGCMTFGVPERGDHPWTLPEEQSRPLIRQAVDAGINYFDTANTYSDGTSEEIVGRALKDFTRRDEVVIATKVYFPDAARAPTAAGCPARRFSPQSTPACGGSEPTTWICTRSIAGITRRPIEETLEALHDVVKSGKARYIGASSMYAWQFSKALYLARQHGWTPFVSMQNHYNLLYREEEREMMPLCAAERIAVVPWSPLARGRLTRAWETETARTRTDEYGNKLYEATVEADRKVVEQVAAIAAARGSAEGASRARLGCAEALRHGAHRRRLETPASR